MFKAVHTIQKKAQTGPEKQVFKTGITFVKAKHVNRKFTYKELTLILGVVVALIVAFTLWFTQDGLTNQSIVTRMPQMQDVGSLTIKLLRKASTALFLFF